MAGRAPQVRKRQDLFIAAFKRVGTIFGACRKAGLGRETVRGWRKEDPDFEARFVEADLDLTEELEQEAFKRARRSSDTMLIFLLKARKPELYRDRLHHSGEIRNPIVVDLSKFTRAELLKMAEIKE